MGKGDLRTRRGKLYRGSKGKTLQSKRKGHLKIFPKSR
ncbi:MAG: 30S ribosomal protein THX [Calditrichaeota bacterium]|nr:30S ribosomal protein THX [Calditrichota bacterium]